MKSMATRSAPEPRQVGHRPAALVKENAVRPSPGPGPEPFAAPWKSDCTAPMRPSAVTTAPASVARRELRTAEYTGGAPPSRARAARHRTGRPSPTVGSSTSKSRLDLPLPETPVTATRPAPGRGTSMDRRWFAWQPSRAQTRGGGASDGAPAPAPPASAAAVGPSPARTSSADPAATTSPPRSPAPGPSSIR